MELADASCSAYECPFRFSYQMETPPTRLRAADPAPSLTTSDNSRGSRLSPRAFDVARPRAAKPDAEKPRPFPLRFAFLDSTLTRVESRNANLKGKGLGFSASGFAALGLATSKALGLSLEPRELSEVVRLGAGSAARSLVGGVSIWYE